VNLAALGVVSGDTIRLRYDFGMDGCAGIDGWYVDDVTVTVCDLVPPTVEVVAGGSVNGDSGGTFNLSVGDADGDPADLTLSATSSNQSLVPAALISFGGSGADRTVTLNAKNKKSGTAVVTVTATDADGGSASVVIRVFVGSNKNNGLNGTAGVDLILGRNGNDTLTGLGGVDLIGGGRGVDAIDAGAGDDTMSGGAGNDVLTGGSGADVFDGGAGTDTATDFNAAEGDTIVGIP
jgi:Ca2+-binding RTX toxin-like protein